MANKSFSKSDRFRTFMACDRKRQFMSEQAAKTRAGQIRASGGPDFRVYQCPHCNGWHLAKRK